MDTFRYGLTVALVCLLPPFLLYWPVVHGLIGFWRKLGPTLTFVVVLGATLAGALAIYRVREHVVVGDYGTNAVTTALGIALVAASIWLRRRVQRELSMSVLVGVPELAPATQPQRLVRSGIYGRIRHPRYTQFFSALLGYALVANYLSAYVVWLSWLPGVWVLVWFEERELRARFGAEYEQYGRQVPRFVPRLRRGR